MIYSVIVRYSSQSPTATDSADSREGPRISLTRKGRREKSCDDLSLLEKLQVNKNHDQLRSFLYRPLCGLLPSFLPCYLNDVIYT